MLQSFFCFYVCHRESQRRRLLKHGDATIFTVLLHQSKWLVSPMTNLSMTAASCNCTKSNATRAMQRQSEGGIQSGLSRPGRRIVEAAGRLVKKSLIAGAAAEPWSRGAHQRARRGFYIHRLQDCPRWCHALP